jgi:hypothetical protein
MHARYACRFAPALAEAVEEAKEAVRMDDEAAFVVLKDMARTELVKMINAARNKGTACLLSNPSLSAGETRVQYAGESEK